jgi:3-isopropylmalate/(R)-2-methylmalate dehydratase small subunit
VESLTRVAGIAVPLLRPDIDTDQIIPVAEMMRSSDNSLSRWGAALFANWRYLAGREPNPDFILNQEPWNHAVILLTDRNFACGSSREAAPMALRGFGFRAVVAPSFAGIFFNNSFRNGVLPVELSIDKVRSIAEQVEQAGGHAVVTVDLEQQRVVAPDGTIFAFNTPPTLREMLLTGRDEVEQTLSRRDEIQAFRDRDAGVRPWVYHPGLDH